MKNKIKQKIKKALPFLLVVLLSVGMILSCYFVTKHFEGENTLTAGADETLDYYSDNLFSVSEYNPEFLEYCSCEVNGLSLTVSAWGPGYYANGFSKPEGCYTGLVNDEWDEMTYESLNLNLSSNEKYYLSFDFGNVSSGIRKVRVLLAMYGESVGYSYKALCASTSFLNERYSVSFNTGSGAGKYGLIFGLLLDERSSEQSVSVTFERIMISTSECAYVPSLTDFYNVFHTGYDNGFEDGYNEGYGVGNTDGAETGYEVGFEDGYNDGYSAITQETIDELESEVLTDGETFLDFIFAIFDAPLNVIRTALDFEILGFNVSDLIFFILTLFLFVMVLKKIKGG